MSKCVVHMQKMKMGAMGGIQSHNQREHESSQNKEIDYSRSKNNYDFMSSMDLNYAKAVKERIAELNLPKAIRHDAVVYCSFVISSDKGFFDRLGNEYIREVMGSPNGWSMADYEVADEETYQEILNAASAAYFEKATDFFMERYGEENIINATVHMDEHTPHMHLGLVPVTPDGRLSAKALFTKQELRDLQTEFASSVGEQFRLERGKEGSKAKHLDEVTFKLEKRQEQLSKAQGELFNRGQEISRLEKTSESLKSEISALERYKTTLERRMMPLKGKIELLEDKLERLQAEPQLLMQEFVQHPSVKPTFDNYCLTARRRQQQERAERENIHKMGWNYWKERMEREYNSSAERNQNDIPRNNEYER